MQKLFDLFIDLFAFIRRENDTDNYKYNYYQTMVADTFEAVTKVPKMTITTAITIINYEHVCIHIITTNSD